MQISQQATSPSTQAAGIRVSHGDRSACLAFFAGIGIALYGVAYFLVHDVFVHQRVKWLRVARLKYFKAMRQTHHLHHEVHTKEGAEAFGFLFVPKRYLTKYGRD